MTQCPWSAKAAASCSSWLAPALQQLSRQPPSAQPAAEPHPGSPQLLKVQGLFPNLALSEGDGLS